MNVDLMIMSGVEDGMVLTLDDDAYGDRQTTAWTLTIGRREESDICLRNDTFISREHAKLHWRSGAWWLEDCESKNGSFLETGDEDARVSGRVPLQLGQLFRIGRTWLRLQPSE